MSVISEIIKNPSNLITQIAVRMYKVKVINEQYNKDSISARRRDDYFINKLKIDFNIEKEKLDAINEFWRPYRFAFDNNPKTQIAFYKISGVFDPSFIGFGLQRYSLVRFWNNITFSVFRNKSFSKTLFPFIKTPINYVENIYGTYVNDNHEILSEDEAVEYIAGVIDKNGSVIIKPSLDSGSGSSVRFLKKGIDKHSIVKLFHLLKENFIVQQVINNHTDYSAPCSKSLNTLRVITLIHERKVCFVGAVFRMGVDKEIDNWDAGGIVCQVNEDGMLGEYAVNGLGERFLEHPNGFIFKNKKLFKADEVIKTALNCHSRIPQQKYISWDFTVDSNGEIVFIEMNSPGGSEVCQVVGINAYKNQSIAKRILDEYLINRFFYKKATFNWDYREFSDHISLVKYYGLNDVVRIPNYINNKKVTIVYSDAFDGCKIKQIKISRDIQFDISKIVRNKISVVYER